MLHSHMPSLNHLGFMFEAIQVHVARPYLLP